LGARNFAAISLRSGKKYLAHDPRARDGSPCEPVSDKAERRKGKVSASTPKLGAMQTLDGRGEDSTPDTSQGIQSRETGDQDETRETSTREELQNFTQIL